MGPWYGNNDDSNWWNNLINLFEYFLKPRTFIFHPNSDATITELDRYISQAYVRREWHLSTQGSSLCHSSCDTGPRLCGLNHKTVTCLTDISWPYRCCTIASINHNHTEANYAPVVELHITKKILVLFYRTYQFTSPYDCFLIWFSHAENEKKV